MRYLLENITNIFAQSRKIIICGVLILVAGIMPVFVNNIIGYLPILVIVLSIAGSRFYLYLQSRYLRFEETSVLSNCPRGTEIDFKVNIQNESMLLYPRVEPYFYISDLFGDDDTLISNVITFTPKEARDFGFEVNFEHIGKYSAGLKRIEYQDLFGLFTGVIENEKEYSVNVVPKIVDLSEVRISDSVVSESQKQLLTTPMDSNDYMGVREYVIGDPIKNIHWKLSARTESYMTKMFEVYTNTGVCIIWDFHAPEYDHETLMTMFDAIVETGLSVGVYAQNRGLDSQILYYDDKGSKMALNDYSRDHFADLIDDIPKIHTEYRRESALEILREEGNSIYAMGNIAICTADFNDQVIEALISIKNRRKNPILFAIIPKNLTEDERRGKTAALRWLDDAGITYYVLSAVEDLIGGDSV